MRILVTYAVQGEFTELKFPGLIGEEEVQIGYLRTGVGKVKSAFYLSEAISHAQPDLVVNVCIGLPVRGQSTKNNARTRKGRKKTVANKKKATK